MMTRYVKNLGPALVVALAMIAIAASVASAQTQFHSSASPNTLTGTQGATADKFTTTAGSAECKKKTLNGEVISPTTTTVEVTSTYSECTLLSLPAVIATNGCKFLFHIDPNNLNVTTGTMDILCPAGKEITATASVASTAKCIVHIPPQTGLGTVTFSNSKPKVHIAVNISGSIKYSHTEGSGIGKCASGSGTTGAYTGTGLVSGDSGEIFVG